eukprot:TRINITY_DN1942_c0_g1_i10.p2 TRINITY_DN1942_c0_g1~~TRINITY_DN1942_c0_g1_i10.p2  ORF type:complete len:103 (+),score=9.69 TRINITY_DN1942_c0_g1_i10:244-552(+)
MQEIDRYACEGVNRLIIGNKSDLTSKRTVTTQTGTDYAASLQIPFIETSAKSAENVEAAFLKMASEIKARMGAAIVPGSRGMVIKQGDLKQVRVSKNDDGCC